MSGRVLCSLPSSRGKDGDEMTRVVGCSHGSSSTEESGAVEEEEEEDAQETTMVLTCEGNISDPNLSTKLECLMHRLQQLTQCEHAPRVHIVEPWNSVRVTFSIPREAARRLHLLAQAGEPALRSLGILSVQVQGDQVISLRLAGGSSSSEGSEVVLRATDGPVSSNVMERISGLLGPAGATNHMPHHHHVHLPSQQPVQFRPAHPQPGPSFPYGQQSIAAGGGGGLQPHGALVARNTALHHRPAYGANHQPPPPPPPPPYPNADLHQSLPHGSQPSSSFIVHNDSAVPTSSQAVPSYRLASVAGSPAMLGTAVASAGGRHVIVRPPPPAQQGQLIHQQQLPPQHVTAATATSSASPVVTVTTKGNVVKNSPLLVELLQQPDQVTQSKTVADLGVASSQLTSLATTNHYTVSNPSTSSHLLHRQGVNSSLNQYSSTTKSKDGLTTHQLVFSGGSVITNARVPVPGGLQQHPQATGKPPPVVSVVGVQPVHQATIVSSSGMPVTSVAVSVGLSRGPKLPYAVAHMPAVSSTSGPMQQASILPQRSNISSVASSSNVSVLPGPAAVGAAASPSPAISPTPSLPSPHPSSTPGITQAPASSMPVFSSNHVTALTPPLTPSNQQGLASASAVAVSNGTSATSFTDTAQSSLPSESHSAFSASVSTNASTSSTSMETKLNKAPSPKMVGSKESQYLINPNTGLLEPRHNTDSSDSESDQRPSSPIQKNYSQLHQPLQTLPKASSSSFLSDQTSSIADQSTVEGLDSLPLSAGAEEKSNEGSVIEGLDADASVGKDGIHLPTSSVEASKLSSFSSLSQSDSKEENSGNSPWEDNSRIVTTPGTGELRLKLKLGKERVAQKVFKPNLPKKLEKKDMSANLNSANQASSEQRIPKIHIKFGSHTSVIVKAEEKEKNRKLLDQTRDDRKRKGSRKKARIGDCDNDRTDSLRLKQSCVPDSLKLNDAKRMKLEVDSDDVASMRTKEGVDGRTKGPRTYEDRYSSKIDNVKVAKFDSKLRTRPKIKTHLRKLGGINNIGELTSHKILETLPPSITKVAAMHTQQPHRNPTSSCSSSSSNFFGSSDQSVGSPLSDLAPSLKESTPPSVAGKSPLLNGDLSHTDRGAISRVLQSSAFSELTSAGKLTIKCKPNPAEPMRTPASLSLLKKEPSHSDPKRKLSLSCVPTYLNSSVLINKVSSGAGSPSSYSRLHDSDRGRPSATPAAAPPRPSPKGGDLLKTALCANFPSLNANSDITIQSVRKKDVLSVRPGSDDGQAARAGTAHKSPSYAPLPDGLNKAGRVTCIDVTDRRAVEEAVKSSRNSSGATNDNQPKMCDKLERWSCGSSGGTSSSTVGSSSSSLPSSSLVSSNLAVRLQPDSTNFFSSSVSVESEDPESGSKSSSYQPSSDGDSGVHKSLVESSSLAVNTSNCDSSIRKSGGDEVSGSVCVTTMVSTASADSTSYVVNCNSGGGPSKSLEPNKEGASTSVSTASCGKAEVESPEGTPKGEHGAGGQGGEDSGIESMDALSEKSPNQSDQSPHRRDDKECESFSSDTSKPASSGCPRRALSNAPSAVAAQSSGGDCSNSPVTTSGPPSNSSAPAAAVPSAALADASKQTVSRLECLGVSERSNIELCSSAAISSIVSTSVASVEEQSLVSEKKEFSSDAENFRLVPSTAKTTESELNLEEGEGIKNSSACRSSDPSTSCNESKPVSCSPVKTSGSCEAVTSVATDTRTSLVPAVLEAVACVSEESQVNTDRSSPIVCKVDVNSHASSATVSESEGASDPGRGAELSIETSCIPLTTSTFVNCITDAATVEQVSVNSTATVSTAMIFLASSAAASSTISSISSSGAPKVVTIKSSSFTGPQASNLTPPVGKAFRLVSLPENISMSPSGSPVKTQLVTFKQLVPASSGASQAKTGLISAISSKADDGPPSLLKAQLLAPHSNAHHAYSFVSGVHASEASPMATSATNGEQDTLDFVGFSSSSVAKVQTSTAKISQIITPEKDELKSEILSPTEDEPKPLRVQPPLYTYGGNKDRKKDFENEAEEREKLSPSYSAEKDSAETQSKNETALKDLKTPKLEDPVALSKSKSGRDFDVLTIEIPANNAELLDEKRLTRATRHSARIASPKINSCEVSPKSADRGTGFPATTASCSASQPLLHLQQQQQMHMVVPSSSSSYSPSTSLTPSMSSLANSCVSISGRVLANSGSITVTSLSGAAPKAGASPAAPPATRGANKRRRYESNEGVPASGPAAKQPRRGRVASTEPQHKIHNTRPADPNLRYAGADSSSSEDEEGSRGSGVVVVGVASCLAEAAAASSATAAASATAEPSPSSQSKRRTLPFTSTSLASTDDDDELRSSRNRANGTRSRGSSVFSSNGLPPSCNSTPLSTLCAGTALTRAAAAAAVDPSGRKSPQSAPPPATSVLSSSAASSSGVTTSSTITAVEREARSPTPSRRSAPATRAFSLNLSNSDAPQEAPAASVPQSSPTENKVGPPPGEPTAAQPEAPTGDAPAPGSEPSCNTHSKAVTSNAVVNSDATEDNRGKEGVSARETRGAAAVQGTKPSPTALPAAAASNNKANNNNNTTNANNNNSKSDDSESIAASDNRRKTRSAAAAPEEGHNKRRRVSKDK